MKRTCWRTSGFLVGTLLLFDAVSSAATINIDLMQELLSGSPGAVLTFSGTLSNTLGSTVFLNSAGINLSGGFTPADEDIGPFFMNAPLFLGIGEYTATIGLFAISIPNPFAQGLYQGTFTVLGGTDENAQDTLGSANFTINAVPEPSSGALFIAGCLVLRVCSVVWARRKMKFIRQNLIGVQ